MAEIKIEGLNVRMEVWLGAWLSVAGTNSCQDKETATAWAKECLKAFDVEFMEENEEDPNKALGLITAFGGVDGGHHKQWLIDQLVRVLAPDYEQWVKDYENGADGVKTYTWDIGIDP